MPSTAYSVSVQNICSDPEDRLRLSKGAFGVEISWEVANRFGRVWGHGRFPCCGFLTILQLVW